MSDDLSSRCPIGSRGDADTITLAHGEGGRLMRKLLQDRVLPILGIDLRDQGDAAMIATGGESVAFTTDCYVVSPLFFPGGDIGKLAVLGTANDLAVSGARPLWISLGMIIEEGLPWSVLERVLRGVADAARQADVRVVTGDTKVVPRGAADQIYLCTSGIGQRFAPSPEWPGGPVGPGGLQVGDELIVTGPIGRHGVAVMSARESFGFLPEPTSDCASLVPAVEAMYVAKIVPRAMRDATRGGVAAVLHEWAAASGLAMAIEESELPVTDEVAGVCELLGLDPLHVANEGTMVVAVPGGTADAFVRCLRTTEVAAGAKRIGEVAVRDGSPVVVRRALGRAQPLDEPLGAPLPRIC
jgi:hydrogenase expression/formation protein HypE